MSGDDDLVQNLHYREVSAMLWVQECTKATA